MILANLQKGGLFELINEKGVCLNQSAKRERKGGKDLIGCGQMQGIAT